MITSLFLALIWGAVWASILQFTRFGRWLAIKRTWLTVVIGVGVDLAISLRVIPRKEWVKLLAIITCSSVGIITRSLSNELSETLRDINDIKDPAR